MAYQVQVAPAAARQLSKFDPPVQRRLVAAMETLASNPRPPGVSKIQGEENLWRIRTGDYRIVYAVYDKRLVVLVVAFGHRREIYR